MHQKLEMIAELADDWNCYGAKPFDKDLLQSAQNLLSILPEPEYILPTGRNSIQFEWDVGKNYLELEIFKDRASTFYVPGRDYFSSEIDGFTPDRYSELPEIIQMYLDKGKD